MIDPQLMEILCCPADCNGQACHGLLEERGENLRCVRCGLIYPVENGIPVMLVGKARKADQ